MNTEEKKESDKVSDLIEDYLKGNKIPYKKEGDLLLIDLNDISDEHITFIKNLPRKEINPHNYDTNI